MKNYIIFIFFLFPFYYLGQQKPFYKKTIYAFELSNGDTLNKKKLITYYDSLNAVIKSEDNFANAVSGDKRTTNTKNENIHSIVEVKNDSLFIKTDINSKGDTVGKIIYKYDKMGNRTHYYQILKGDTLNAQKRVYDENGNYTKLFNRNRNNSEYYLSMEWTYDEKGNPTERKTYNENNQLIEIDRYENTYMKNGDLIIVKSSYQNGKGFVKQYKAIESNQLKKTYFYSSFIGYNYGIELKHVKGGYKIEEFNEQGKLRKLEYYDNRKKMIALVEIIEETLN